ncbi:MAG: Fe-S cluster-containing hydrogenase [Saprospiraceae bacterium]|nr:Fe-S cluster-containing hydrogenase [Saprospiraceae bacterium]
MEKVQTNIWIGQEDLENGDKFIELANQEFSLVESVSDERNQNLFASNRRDFLKYLGFGLGAATMAAGCDIPVKRAIPYVVKPDAIVPGVATYYASSYVDGGDYAAILVKTRDGRPIKIEGNDLAPAGWGSTSARVQASVLGLYDTNRLATPIKKSGTDHMAVSWADLDADMIKSLATATNVRILKSTTISPTGNKALGEFVAKYPSTKVVSIDDQSYAGLLDANQASFGVRVIPGYNFDKAEVIVSFGADFLGTWVAPSKFAGDYVKMRQIKDVNAPKMSRHIQVESGMTLTGSNADNRILVRPSEQGAAISHLYNEIVGGGAPSAGLNEKAKKSLTVVAGELKAAAGKSLVVAGSNNMEEQLLINAINNALTNYGATIDFSQAILTKQGDDAGFAALLAEMKAGSVDLLIVDGANPVYSQAKGKEFATALAKVKTKIAIGLSKDETSSLCDYIATKPHFLESWGDAQPTATTISLIQPTIAPLFDSRQAELSYLTWAQSANLVASDQPYFEYLKANWQATAFAAQSEFATFDSFWDNALQLGVLPTPSSVSAGAFSGDVSASFGNVTKPGKSEIEISFYESISLGNGQYATNPWLQEMPNPIDRTVWGNYLAVPVNFDGYHTMEGLNKLVDGDLVKLTVGGEEFTVPVIQQFGQMPGTVAIAMGYGRTEAGACGTGVGVDVNPHRTMAGAYAQPFNTQVTVSNKIGKEDHFSCVQYHHTMGVKGEDKASGQTINADEAATVFFDYFTGIKGFQGSLTERSIIYTANTDEVKEKAEILHKKREHAQFLNSKQIYGGHDYNYASGHHWGMHIDLNACIGCGACTVACMSENNVPVVGKREVARHHEMTWLRIDRYYYGDVENPSTVYQPMMCQHCDNAPCENVCPVNATNHSSEGLNQMTYNRCIGTRYCANNCPYKVRRFNWLDYTTADTFPANQIKKFGEEIPFGAENLTRMVLNPDVTVRSKGVIEKCSFCVQRLQEGKLTAKREGRGLRDADVKTACQTSCPTGAITFGDMNSKDMLAEKLENPLNYIVLEEINVRPSVNYTMRITNKNEAIDA